MVPASPPHGSPRDESSSSFPCPPFPTPLLPSPWLQQPTCIEVTGLAFYSIFFFTFVCFFMPPWHHSERFHRARPLLHVPSPVTGRHTTHILRVNTSCPNVFLLLPHALILEVLLPFTSRDSLGASIACFYFQSPPDTEEPRSSLVLRPQHHQCTSGCETAAGKLAGSEI